MAYCLFCLVLSHVVMSCISLSSHSIEKCLSNASAYNGSGGINSTSACLESNIYISLKPSGMKVPANKAQPIPVFVPFPVVVAAEADSVSILNELSALHNHSSDINEDPTESPSPNPNDNDEIGPLNTLKKTRVANINRLIIGHLNINSLRNKIEALKSVNGNIDILVITETKIDQIFYRRLLPTFSIGP